jgi:hypothetical protein
MGFEDAIEMRQRDSEIVGPRLGIEVGPKRSTHLLTRDQGSSDQQAQEASHSLPAHLGSLDEFSTEADLKLAENPDVNG